MNTRVQIPMTGTAAPVLSFRSTSSPKVHRNFWITGTWSGRGVCDAGK
jgi:hypothetical protein